ncbi:hypothetical protein pEaSNUABM37_00298 [Erwinia phage pEa_SNUABM_37]|nr:hypothetical protein pEaSNUABM37_00298 [Erwinia phage pEa_SNUABM_37]QXO10766.1 hypothetical protein pEaSNUABM48_00298 [Erwinia phage pEa_SNUABM_48]
MLEALLGKPNIKSKYLVDINFEAESVGSRLITDRGTLGVNLVRNVSTGTRTDGVVDDPTFGKCYKFDGGTIFVGDKNPAVWNKQYRMELKFVNIGTNSSSVICCGDYPGSAATHAGWELSPNQYPSTYMQMFMVTQQNSYTRLLLPGTNPGPTVLETIIVTRVGSTITMSNPRTGQSVTSTFDTGNDYRMHVGGVYSMNYGAAFQGLLKSFTIELT